ALPEPLEEAALCAALDRFAPDLVVFDTHAPLPVVEHVATRGSRTVLVLRELRPEALRSFAASQAALAFDRIVVPHEHGDMDLASLEGLPVALVGPVVRALGACSEPQSANRPLLVAIAGGGGQPVDARRYVRAVADAHLLARARFPALETVLVPGP